MTNLFTNSKIAKSPQYSERNYLFPLLFSVILTLFLFYIDEGYYDFRWTEDPANIPVLICYMLGFFIGMAIISGYTFKSQYGITKNLIIIGLGLPLGVLFVILLMYVVAVLGGIYYFLTN